MNKRNSKGQFVKIDPIKRFWKQVNKQSPDKCWLWKAKITTEGYGEITIYNDKSELAHRFSWKLHNKKEIPKGYYICHQCDVKACVNPFHLFLALPKENSQDMINKNRSLVGEKNPSVKLTKEQVLEIRNKYIPNKTTMQEIADQYNVSKQAIYRIVRKISWKHLK